MFSELSTSLPQPSRFGGVAMSGTVRFATVRFATVRFATVLLGMLFFGNALLVPARLHAQPGGQGAAVPAAGEPRVLYASPQAPRGTVVMLPGGSGDVGLDEDGDVAHGKNFVVRTRDLWTARGYAVMIPDAEDGRNLRGLRNTPEYAKVVGDLVRAAHARAPGPVFLLGTSQGAVAAMNGAAHLSKAELAGVILTESVSRHSKSGETVFDASPDRVTAPALVVANRDSACRVAPPEDASRIAAAMTGAAEVKVIYVQGGVTRSWACGSESPHGYFGIESAVVDQIADWLDAHR
jgi:pimeloyl-ACP methyl ester carboxylesterase